MLTEAELTVSSRQETPVVFSAADQDLVGIFTRPLDNANGAAVVTLSGGGGLPMSGRNRTRARLSRELAARGFHVLRFNYTGIGESGGTISGIDLQNPWAEDVVAAVKWVKAQGFDKIILIGLCAGGRAGLTAVGHLPEVVGVALVSPPVEEIRHQDARLAQPLMWHLKGLARSPGRLRLLIADGQAKRRRRLVKAKLRRLLHGGNEVRPDSAAQVFPMQLRAALDSGTNVLFLYGNGDDFYPNFQRAQAGILGRIIEQGKAQVGIRVVDMRLDGLRSVESQDIFFDTLISWTDSVLVRAK